MSFEIQYPVTSLSLEFQVSAQPHRLVAGVCGGVGSASDSRARGSGFDT